MCVANHKNFFCKTYVLMRKTVIVVCAKCNVYKSYMDGYKIDIQITDKVGCRICSKWPPNRLGGEVQRKVGFSLRVVGFRGARGDRVPARGVTTV